MICDYRRVESKSGFVQLLVSNNTADSGFDEFMQNGKLVAPAILNRFKLLTWQAICKVNLQGNDHIYCPKYDWFNMWYPPASWHALPNKTTGFHMLNALTLIWTCGTYKRMAISVDLNPVVFVKKWPQNFRQDSRLMPNLQNEGFYAIPKEMVVQGKHGHSVASRISLSHIETQIFRDMPRSALEAYRLIQALREPPVTPVIVNGQDQKRQGQLTVSLQLDLRHANDSASSKSADRPNVDELLRFLEKRPTHYFKVGPSGCWLHFI